VRSSRPRLLPELRRVSGQLVRYRKFQLPQRLYDGMELVVLQRQCAPRLHRLLHLRRRLHEPLPDPNRLLTRMDQLATAALLLLASAVGIAKTSTA